MHGSAFLCTASDSISYDYYSDMNAFSYHLRDHTCIRACPHAELDRSQPPLAAPRDAEGSPGGVKD